MSDEGRRFVFWAERDGKVDMVASCAHNPDAYIDRLLAVDGTRIVWVLDRHDHNRCVAVGKKLVPCEIKG